MAIRTGRFDAIVEVGYPSRTDAARVLAALIGDLRGGHAVVTAAVVVASPENTSGSDIRDIVRRAVVVGDGAQVSTASLFAEVGSGRYRASIPEGMYL
ncbi:hypothetical protein P5V34_01800 [Mycobacteroides abscessus subsp. abscessus]|uniref:hypothetical protein n=1 Tax=Mycobacteroides abscessus TaxID=36809 RepID=UPI00266D8E93|nr:hypothetical protein [Mycobacteroides abscessus]MDO3012713.1 hypothetical protein [Mycobacteroides abscessus subsp. abscessus]